LFLYNDFEDDSSKIVEAVDRILDGRHSPSPSLFDRKTGRIYCYTGRMKKILVADDSLVTQLSLRNILERSGYDVHIVEDGAAALQALQETSFDLVISDITMPEIDGLTLLHTIRTAVADTPISPTLPFILITGTVEQMARAEQATANAVLSKPFGSWQVREVVETVLAEAGAGFGSSP
jgi:CheY-like chemotaxis protein